MKPKHIFTSDNLAMAAIIFIGFGLIGLMCFATIETPMIHTKRVTATVSKILTCDNHTNICRVQFSNGWRHNVTQPVVIGDKYHYTMSWRPKHNGGSFAKSTRTRITFDGRSSR